MRICRSSRELRSARKPSSCREKEDRGDEREGAVDYDAHQAEGQQAQPDERIEDERSERERPADDEENAEEEEFEHDVSGFQGGLGG